MPEHPQAAELSAPRGEVRFDKVRFAYPGGPAVLDGVDRAFLLMADDNGAVFAAVAGEVGLGHAVLLSSFTVGGMLPSGEANFFTARHRAGEQALTEAGVPSTFLRATGFDYNLIQWTSGIGEGVVRAPFADLPLPKVDPADVHWMRL